MFYDDFYKNNKLYKKEALEIQPYIKIWNKVVELINDSDKKQIIELGCGMGHLAQLVNQNSQNNIEEYIGYDISKYAINTCKKKFQNNEKYKFIELDVIKNNIKFESNYIIVAIDFLDIINSDLNFLENIKLGTKIIFTLRENISKMRKLVFGSVIDIKKRYEKIVYFDKIVYEIINKKKVFYCVGKIINEEIYLQKKIEEEKSLEEKRKMEEIKKEDIEKKMKEKIQAKYGYIIEMTKNIKNVEDNVIYNKSFIWNKDNSDLKIEMTVALPVLKGKNIIYLALESLKNQIDLNFGWELIILEENGESIDRVKEYKNILPNCQRIVHIGINKKISLMNKWKGIASLSSKTSKIYVMHAADCYSPPKRLWIHYEHFKNENCKFSTQRNGLFYNLLNNKKIIYVGKSNQNHLNMALRTKDMLYIPYSNLYMGIDKYILSNIKGKTKKYIYFDTEIDKNNWKYSIDTDGANNISIYRRKSYNNVKAPFIAFNKKESLGYIEMKEYIPQYIIEFLENYK